MEIIKEKTNGKATKKDALQKPIVTPKKRLEKKTTATNVTPKVEKKEEVKKEETVLTLDQKIEKVENLKTLIDKREKLEESRKKLSSFVVGTNQFSETLVLNDESGNTFKTSNSEVFTKVVASINETLVEKIKEIENQIKF
jgi:uncharacterized protein YigA (DUF484 family)